LEEGAGKIVHVRLSGKLGEEDYERFVPKVERLIRAHGKIRVLGEMHDFHGWERGALWEGIKVDRRHFRGIERIAVGGGAKGPGGEVRRAVHHGQDPLLGERTGGGRAPLDRGGRGVIAASGASARGTPRRGLRRARRGG